MKCNGVAISARGLTVRGPRGIVFEGVDADVDAGGLLMAHGPAGCGRTAFLLTLAARMQFIAGTLWVDGQPLPRAGTHVRSRIALARVDTVFELEPRLTVGELKAERRWTSPVRSRTAEACETTGVTARDKDLVDDLPPDESLVLAIAMALGDCPGALVIDNVGQGCTPGGAQRVRQALAQVQATGCTVVASDVSPAEGAINISLNAEPATEGARS